MRREEQSSCHPNFGDKAPSDSLPEQWASFGIPLVLLIGLALGRVATVDKAKIPLFKIMLQMARDTDLDLPLMEAFAKIVKQCAMMSVAASNFISRKDRGESDDLHLVEPCLTNSQQRHASTKLLQGHRI